MLFPIALVKVEWKWPGGKLKLCLIMVRQLEW